MRRVAVGNAPAGCEDFVFSCSVSYGLSWAPTGLPLGIFMTLICSWLGPGAKPWLCRRALVPQQRNGSRLLSVPVGT